MDYNMPIFYNMGIHMKTTLDLADPLFHAAKKVASQHKITLRTLVEEGLRMALERRAQGTTKAYVLPDCRASLGAEVLVNDPKQWSDMETEWLMKSFKLDHVAPAMQPEPRA